jgi:hypothetical protein
LLILFDKRMWHANCKRIAWSFVVVSKENLMVRRKATQMALALLVGTSIPLVGLPASAQTKKALVRFVYTQNGGTDAGDPANITPLAFYYNSGTGIATIGTGPTPSVMWPAYIFSYMKMGFTTGPMTPSFGYTATFKNAAATIRANHANQATEDKTFRTPGPLGKQPAKGITVMGSTWMGTQLLTTPTLTMANTSICFSRNPPAFPGSCKTRLGTLHRVPGSKRYGGTARLLHSIDTFGTFIGAQFGTILFRQTAGNAMPCYPLVTPNCRSNSPMLTGPSGIGNYGHNNIGEYTFLPGLTTIKLNQQRSELPFTTGMATAIGNYYETSVAQTGSHNFNPTNLTGMISLVKPFLFQGFQRFGPVFGGQSNPSLGNIERVELTFLPEPSMLVLLGSGVLGLAGLSRLRKR